MAILKKDVVGVNEGIEGKLIDLIRRNNSQNFSLEIIYKNGGWQVALHDEEAADHDEDAVDGPTAGEGVTFYDAWKTQTPISDDAGRDADYFRDVELAGDFLTGGHSLNGSFPEKAYLKGSKENEARDALIRLLRNGKPLDVSLARKLAALFDPLPETGTFSSFDMAPVERKLRLIPRKSGLMQNMRKLEMALAFERRLFKVRRWLTARIEKTEARTNKGKIKARRRRQWAMPRNLRERILIKFAVKHNVSERTVQTAVNFLRKQK
jgi:hypothetical protein